MDLSQDARDRRQKMEEKPRRHSELPSSVYVSEASHSLSHEFPAPPMSCPGDSPQQRRGRKGVHQASLRRGQSSLPWELTLRPPHTLEFLQ